MSEATFGHVVVDPTISGLLPKVTDEANALFSVLAARTTRNQERLDLYDGKHAVEDLGISTPPSMKDLAVVLGWPAKACDMLGDLCIPAGFAMPGSDSIPGVARLWEQNDLQMQLLSAAHLSLVSSVSWLVTTRGADDEPDVVWQVKDAMNGTGRFNTATRRLDSFLSITARDEARRPVSAVLYLPGQTILLDLDEQHRWRVATQETSLAKVPVERYAYRPDDWRPFGRSRISRDVEYLTKAAMRTLLRSEVSAEFYSFPQRWAMGADAEEFEGNDGARLGRWRTLLGGMLAIGKDDDGDVPTVGEFRAAPQTPHTEQLGVLAQAFAGTTSIPVSSLGVGMQQANPTSSDAYITGRQDLIRLARRAMRVWGQSSKRAMLTSLELLNGTVPDEMWSMKQEWDDPAQLPANTSADNLSKITTALPWVADTPEAVDMLGLSEVATASLKAQQRRARSTSILAQLGVTDGPSAAR